MHVQEIIWTYRGLEHNGSGSENEPQDEEQQRDTGEKSPGRRLGRHHLGVEEAVSHGQAVSNLQLDAVKQRKAHEHGEIHGEARE